MTRHRAAQLPTEAGWRALLPAKGYLQTAESLAIYRMLYALSSLFLIGTTSIGAGAVSSVFGDLPDDLYYPPLGPGMLLGGWPSVQVIRLVEVALTVGLAFILIGAWTRAASVVTAAAGLTLTSLVYSAGKVDHSILWIVVIPLVLAFSAWGDTWSVDAGRRQGRSGFRRDSARSIQLIAACLGIMFASAAVVKAATGWLDPGTSSTLGWAFAQDIQAGVAVTAPPFIDVVPTFLWPALDYLTLIFEAGFLIAMLRRSWLVPYLGLAVVFHFCAGFMGFPGFFDIAVAYLLFIRLDPVAKKFRGGLDWFARLAATRRAFVIGVVLVGTIFYVCLAVAFDGPVTVLRILSVAGVPMLFVVWPVVMLGGLVVLWRRRGRIGQDRSSDKIPAWTLPVAGAVLALQSVLTLAVSEPYPSLAGPLFMGNFDNGREIVVVRPRFYVETSASTTQVAASDVFDLPESRAVQLASVRFPAPYVEDDGGVIKNPSRLEQLAQQYHHFDGRHLPNYGGELDQEARAWVKANLEMSGLPCANECTLKVSWTRLGLDRGDGRTLSEDVVQQVTYDLAPIPASDG